VKSKYAAEKYDSVASAETLILGERTVEMSNVNYSQNVHQTEKISFGESEGEIVHLTENQFTVGGRNSELGSSACVGICCSMSCWFANAADLDHISAVKVGAVFRQKMIEYTTLWDRHDYGTISVEECLSLEPFKELFSHMIEEIF